MSYSFTLNRDQTITLAFQLINVYGLNDTVSTNDNAFANKILNGMLKLWAVESIISAKRKIGYLFPALNTYKYELGSVSGSTNCTNTFVETTLSSALTNGATSIPLTTTSGMAASDYIGIKLNDGTRFWTTISGAPGNPTTIASGVTAAAARGNSVITYTSKLNRPLDIIRSTCIDLSTSQQIENLMTPLNYSEYYNLPYKSLAGTKPLNFYYDNNLNNSLPYTSTLYLFPNPSTVDLIIAFSYMDTLADMNNPTDTMDLAQEWQYPIAFNLACELAYPYGKFTELQALQPKADQLKMIVKRSSYDSDPLTIKLKRHD